MSGRMIVVDDRDARLLVTELRPDAVECHEGVLILDWHDCSEIQVRLFRLFDRHDTIKYLSVDRTPLV